MSGTREDRGQLMTTMVRCGVSGRGVAFTGHLDRDSAGSAARAHYIREMERIRQALEAISANKFRVEYLANGTVLGGPIKPRGPAPKDVHQQLAEEAEGLEKSQLPNAAEML